MPTLQQVDPIVARVERLLTGAASQGVHLRVADSKLDDDWLYVVVVPSKAGVRASDQADAMAKIERQLRAEGHNHVLLVPALED
jgi:hypothetical protein